MEEDYLLSAECKISKKKISLSLVFSIKVLMIIGSIASITALVIVLIPK